MKRNIYLIIYFVLQTVFILLFAIPVTKEFIVENISFAINVWDGFKSLVNDFGCFLGLDKILNVRPRLFNIISIVIFSLFLFIAYQIISLILVTIFRKRRKKRLISYQLDSYSLSEEEKARFEWKLYVRKFSFKGLISYLIPTLIIFIFLIIRFDKEICEIDNFREGYFRLYSNYVEKFISGISPESVKILNDTIKAYINFINQLIELIGVDIIEYILLALAIILIYLSWTVLVYVCVQINKKHAAKARARRARRKYIDKMENAELKARRKADPRISSKASEIIGSENDVNFLDDSSYIAMIGEKYADMDENRKKKEAAYIDDISAGVTDLGFASSGEEEEKEPIERKIPVFVGDEDVDIILETEPYIETIEEDEEFDYDEESMPFFEKYSPDIIDYESLNEKLIEEQEIVIDENGVEKQQTFIEIKDYEDSEKEKQRVLDEINQNKIEDKIEEINDVQIDEPIIQKQIEIEPIIKETNKDINFKKINKSNKPSKPIKPLNIISKYKEEDRFKNAKKKYLNYPLNNKKENKKDLSKKRNLIRRKYKR